MYTLSGITLLKERRCIMSLFLTTLLLGILIAMALFYRNAYTNAILDLILIPCTLFILYSTPKVEGSTVSETVMGIAVLISLMTIFTSSTEIPYAVEDENYVLVLHLFYILVVSCILHLLIICDLE